MSGLRIKSVSLKEANAYIEEHHRHHGAVRGWKFGASVVDEEGRVRGVVIVGRPVARGLDDGETLEVLRCCTDGSKNVCSMLYSAARKAAAALGYSSIVTYTLESESGASLRASGWREVARTKGGSWDTPSRRRTDKAPTEPKVRWEGIATR